FTHFLQRNIFRFAQNFLVTSGTSSNYIRNGSKKIPYNIGTDNGFSANDPIICNNVLSFNSVCCCNQHRAKNGFIQLLFFSKDNKFYSFGKKFRRKTMHFLFFQSLSRIFAATSRQGSLAMVVYCKNR